MTLTIDTAQARQVGIGLKDGEQAIDHVTKESQFGSQAIVGAICEMLRKHHLCPTDVKAITVTTTGPSFTGIRVGVSVANALGYAWNVPVNGCHPPQNIATPAYDTLK